jgi:hypothetical protein
LSSLIIKKESAWTFYTSSNGGIGVEFVAAEGGAIWLVSPYEDYVKYYYGGVGAGYSWGLKVPKVGKVQLRIRGKGITGNVAPASFTNAGKLYILDSFAGDELTASDITGVCMFVELGGGVVAGGSATAMVLGMDPLWLAALLATSFAPNPFIMSKLATSATALLVMGGVNVGLQAQLGGAAYVGALW